MLKKAKANFMVVSLKKNFLTILFALFMIFLLLFSKENMIAAKNSLSLWMNSVVPSLLPFFIATELLGYTNIVSWIGKLLNKIMRPLFNVPGIGAYAFVMGIISGYPIGAKIVTKFRQDSSCTKEEGERLLAFTNNSGPLFIIGTVGISLFGNVTIGLLLFITHILACFSVGILFRFWKRNVNTSSLSYTKEIEKENPELNRLGEILSNSISNAIRTVVLIGGFILLFGLIISILNTSGFMDFTAKFISPFLSCFGIKSDFATPILSGILELTNGLQLVASIPNKAISINIILCAFLLGFSGISIFLQIFSITSKSDLSIKPYLLGKLMQGIFAAFYTYAFIHLFPIFNFDIQPIFAHDLNTTLIHSYYANHNGIILFIILLLIIFLLHIGKKIHKYRQYE